MRFKAAELPPALMQMLKTDWTTVVGQRESFQLALASAQHLKDMVSMAYPAYDCTQMAADIADEAWTEKVWSLFLFEITDALLARPPGIRQMLQYVLENPTAASSCGIVFPNNGQDKRLQTCTARSSTHRCASNGAKPALTTD